MKRIRNKKKASLDRVMFNFGGIYKCIPRSQNRRTAKYIKWYNSLTDEQYENWCRVFYVRKYILGRKDFNEDEFQNYLSRNQK